MSDLLWDREDKTTRIMTVAEVGRRAGVNGLTLIKHHRYGLLLAKCYFDYATNKYIAIFPLGGADFWDYGDKWHFAINCHDNMLKMV